MTDDRVAKLDENLRREARDWVLRLSSGALTAADAAELNRWRATSRAHRRALAEANRLWDMATQGAMEALAEGAPPGWVQSASHPRAGLDRRFFLGGALAASAAGAAYLAVRPPFHLWPALTEFAADVRTNTGQQRNVVSGGGAAVALNTNTSVNFPPSTGGADRIELVAGEAAITTPAVTSRPVVVLAADGRSLTNDAQFNVRYDTSEVEVTCFNGTVQVYCGDRMVTLTRRQQVPYGRGKLGTIVEIDPEVIAAWRAGLLVFRNDPLSHVIDEVNRYRPGKIIVMNEALARQLVFASFRLDRLDEVVPRVAKVFGAHVRTFPAGITVLS
jgi:transmembrane sensor